MSGIVGIVNLDRSPVERELLQRLTDFQSFRGPDAKQIWFDGHAGFGHTLLATTDESRRERQPASVDGNAWIVADARVDARSDLKRELLAHGGPVTPERLAAATDPELILWAYSAWGADCVNHLLGDFAFAIWDRRLLRLFCARDQMGVKPFFYARLGSLFIFSNTLHCLRQHPGVSNRLNDLAIADFLLFDMNQEPDTTSFADIQRLPAAHTLTCQHDEVSTRRYWTLPVPTVAIHYQRPQEYVEHFRELLDAAVADRLRTNSAGILMSGGLDSTTVAASAQRIFTERNATPGLRAYTEVFDSLIPHEERHYAGIAAAALKIPIEFFPADNEPLFAHADDSAYRLPEPAHIAWQGTWTEQAGRVAAQSRIVLTGDGADPALLSRISVHFRNLIKTNDLGSVLRGAVQYLTAEGRLSRLYIRKRLRILRGSKLETAGYPQWLNPTLEKRLNLRDRWESRNHSVEESAAVRPEAYGAVTDQIWPANFEAADPGVVGFPIETRAAFFDIRLLTYLIALEPLPFCCDKQLLRQSARSSLPDAVRLRRKCPLPANPILALLRHSTSAWVDKFEVQRSLTEYILPEKIPTVARENQVWPAWINLRPLSLNYWLRTAI